jgi:hypothetical protein
MAEWLRLLTSNHLLLTAMGSNLDRDCGFFYVRKYPARLWNVGGSTQVPVLARNNVRKATLWSSSTSKAVTLPYDLYSVSVM